MVRYFAGGTPAKDETKADTTKDDELSAQTDNQLEVLKLLSGGFAYKEIADKMGITVDGARSYVRKIYEKLHVHSRLEAAKKFLNR